jgi:RNA polymerase sigma-70 factor (ECF subfamily)
MEQDRHQQFMLTVGPVLARLHRIARVLCGDADVAQDLTQDALVRGLQAFGSFEVGRPILPWLARIMRNVFINYTKSGRARYEVCDEDAVDGAWTPEQPGALDQLERAELIQRLRQEIAELPQPFQLVVILCDQEGFSYEEAAEVGGVPVGTVRSRLARARAVLRTRILARLEHPREAAPDGNSERPPLVLLSEALTADSRQPASTGSGHARRSRGA